MISRWKKAGPALVAATTAMIVSSLMPSVSARAAADDVAGEIVKSSRLNGVAFSEKAFRFTSTDANASIVTILKAVATEGGLVVGASEALAWSDEKKSGSAARVQAIQDGVAQALKASGYWVESAGEKTIDGKKMRFFVAGKSGASDAILGFWMQSDGFLMLGWGKVTPKDAAPAAPVAPASDKGGTETNASSSAAAAAAAAITVPVDAQTMTVNVMKGMKPKLPTFPSLTPKRGTVRGFVLDANGKPLKGAEIGIRSSAIGGAYSGASGKTDAKGYYEVAVPWGAAEFYCAGYVIEYGENLAALSLQPADGEIDSFATANGAVENFVLPAYGVADRAGAQENPRYCNNYYGGDIVLSWYVDDDPRYPSTGKVPMNAEIEVTLTPTGPLIDGSKGRPIVIRKNVGSGSLSQLYVNNIPVAPYAISAKVVGGGALKLREVGPNSGQTFGLEPRQATGKANLLLRPQGAKAHMAGAGHGNWDSVSILLEKP